MSREPTGRQNDDPATSLSSLLLRPDGSTRNGLNARRQGPRTARARLTLARLFSPLYPARNREIRCAATGGFLR
jgi:hypothetical protein